MDYLRTKILVYSDESLVFNLLNKYFKKSNEFWIEKSGKCKIKDITPSQVSTKNHTELEIYYLQNKDFRLQPEMAARDISSLERIFEKLKS